MIYLSVETTTRTVIRRPPVNEIDSAARVWGFLYQEYDTSFTIFGRRTHLETTRRSAGIGRNRRSDLGYHRRLPLSFELYCDRSRTSQNQSFGGAACALGDAGFARANDGANNYVKFCQ